MDEIGAAPNCDDDTWPEAQLMFENDPTAITDNTDAARDALERAEGDTHSVVFDFDNLRGVSGYPSLLVANEAAKLGLKWEDVVPEFYGDDYYVPPIVRVAGTIDQLRALLDFYDDGLVRWRADYEREMAEYEVAYAESERAFHLRRAAEAKAAEEDRVRWKAKAAESYERARQRREAAEQARFERG